jgi:hypothetical protein
VINGKKKQSEASKNLSLRCAVGPDRHLRRRTGLADEVACPALNARDLIRWTSGAMRAQLGAEPRQAGDVVGQLGHADHHRRPGQTDGAHEQRHAVLMGGEDVLDAGAEPGA